MEHKAWVQAEVTRHHHSKISELGDAVLKKRRIYLDVNYWTHLADAIDGKPRHPDYRQLLSILETFVNCGNSICVVGEDTLLELFKRKDQSKRLLLARTMDLLSYGTVIQHSFERAELEIFEFLRENEKDDFCSPPTRLVWRKPCSIFGDVFPIPGSQISRQEAADLSKNYLDYAWDLTFEEMVERLGKSSAPAPNWNRTADFVNGANHAHQEEVGNFGDLFLREAAGVLDGIRLDIAQRRIRDDVTGSTTLSEALEAFQHVQARVLSAFELRAVGTALPFVDIHAGIHTAIRRDKQRRLYPNDFHDFGHAAAALPYCSDFLTDGPLKTLICGGPLKFDQRYGCQVVSSVSEALNLFNDYPTTVGK